MSRYDTLNPVQREAVFHTEGPLLLLAGAGSGKTRVLTHRIAYMIDEKDVSPWNVLAITFTNKAAGEMRERVDQLIEYGAEDIWVSTFHSTCVKILRRYIDRIGYGRNFTIYDGDDQKTIMRDLLKTMNIDNKLFPEKAVLHEISKAKDSLKGYETYQREAINDHRKEVIGRVYEQYHKRLHNSNALDFDDLIVKTVELFRMCSDVLDYYQERFKYIMVDEYQDTNTAQFTFISLLAAKYRNLCVVGDDDQSIYRFRGANIQNILGFEEIFTDATVIKLEQNYRSTKTILRAANQVIYNNVGRKDKTLWTDNEQGELIELKIFHNEYEEADHVVKGILGLTQGGTNYNECAILYRTNAQSRTFEEKLIYNNVPYKLVGGVNFYQRKEIKDILAYLKTIDNGQDDLAVKRIINIPRRGIGLTTIEKAQDYAYNNNMSFFDAINKAYEIPTLTRASAKLDSFVKMIRTFRSKLEFISLIDLLNEILDQTGYIKELEDEDTEEAKGRIENIEELMNKVVAYTETAEVPTLNGFLEEVALVADIDNLNQDANSVTLMTLHSAKGLEFPYVFLVGMEDGIFPSYMSISSGEKEDIEEERRLCYVGITRAMKQLFMSAAKSRMLRGTTQFNKPSRFIKEIAEDLIAETDVATTPVLPLEGKNPFKTAKSAFNYRPYELKEMPKPNTEELDYGVGDMVQHIKFGTGIVTDIQAGGKDYEVTVDFPKFGIKKLFASFAKLKKVE